jgi:thioredoxin-like negative regulator of GroEL
MANRFNVKLPATETQKDQEVGTLHVKEILAKDYDAEVLTAPVPVVLHFHSADSKPSEELAPRFAAVAEKFTGKARFVKILQPANAELAGKLGVTGSPTVVFFKGGQEFGERLSGDDIKRTALKAGVEALLA